MILNYIVLGTGPIDPLDPGTSKLEDLKPLVVNPPRQLRIIECNDQRQAQKKVISSTEFATNVATLAAVDNNNSAKSLMNLRQYYF
jgi:hypothetical protein